MFPPAVSALFFALVVSIPAAVIVLKFNCIPGLFTAALLRKSVLLLGKNASCLAVCIITVRLLFLSRKAVFFLKLPLLSAFFLTGFCFLPCCFPCVTMKTAVVLPHIGIA